MYPLSFKITFEEEKKAEAHIYCATAWDGDIKQISTLTLCHLFILEKSTPLRHFFLPSLINNQALSETIQLDKVTGLDANPVAACFLSPPSFRISLFSQIVCISKSSFWWHMQNTMWHNTIWAPCEKWNYLGLDCQHCVTVITFFQEQRRDSLTTWPAVIIYSLWQYLCIWLDILFSLRWIRNEFGNRINK